MTNKELQNMLKKFPSNMEVGVFLASSGVIRPITNIYKGNERYLPGNSGAQTPDIVVIEAPA